MKALIHSLLFSMGIAVLSSCSTSQYAPQQGSNLEYDDMYYTSADRELALEAARQREAERLQAAAEKQKERQAAISERNVYQGQDAQDARKINPDAMEGYSDEYYEDGEYVDDGYAEEDYYIEDNYYSDQGNNQPRIYNNYYYGGGSFYDPFYNPYIDPYWSRPGMGMGFNNWGWRSGVSFSFGFSTGRFYDPWGYDPFFDSYWGRPWGWDSWGYYNPYARGFRNGFYDGYYRSNYWGAYYPRTVVVYANNSDRRVTYGPRTTRASNRLGVNQHATSERVAPRSGARLSNEDNRSRIRNTNSRINNNALERDNTSRRRVAPSDQNRRMDTNRDTERNTRTRERSNEPTRRSREVQENRSNQRSREYTPQRSTPSRSRESSPTYSPSRSRESSPNYDRGGSYSPSRSRESSSPSNSRSRSRGPQSSNLQENNYQESSPVRTREAYASPAATQRTAVRTQNQVRERAYSAPAQPRESRTSAYSAPVQRTESRTSTYSQPSRSRGFESQSYSQPSRSSYSERSSSSSFGNSSSRSYNSSSNSSSSSSDYSRGGSRSSARSRGGN